MRLAEVLADMGYDVCAIEGTKADAVAAAVRCKPDLMIVDGGVRDGSGVSAVEEILRTGFVLHVFLSGDTSGFRALRPGAVAIQKPSQRTSEGRSPTIELGHSFVKLGHLRPNKDRTEQPCDPH
jgi:two-component system, response regulator PdtaR